MSEAKITLARFAPYYPSLPQSSNVDVKGALLFSVIRNTQLIIPLATFDLHVKPKNLNQKALNLPCNHGLHLARSAC